ncbi:unnamed protein product, partial [Hapterophycus canaliculatus]
MQRMANDAGESATSAAAASTGSLMTLSSWSTTSLEDVAMAGGPGGARWFQLYVYKVRHRSHFRVISRFGHLAQISLVL